jgi:hypothetical protein
MRSIARGRPTPQPRTGDDVASLLTDCSKGQVTAVTRGSGHALWPGTERCWPRGAMPEEAAPEDNRMARPYRAVLVSAMSSPTAGGPTVTNPQEEPREPVAESPELQRLE